MFILTLRMSIDVVAYAFLLWTLAWTVTFYFIPSKRPLWRYQRTGNSHAVIFCVGSDIGYALAQNLIMHGFAITFITSNAARIDDVVEKLKSQTPVAVVHVIRFDISSHDINALMAGLELITKRPVTILIHCLNGLNIQSRSQTLVCDSGSIVDNMIDHGVRFTSQISRLIMPTLVRYGPSIILHVLSDTVAGYPYMSTYSGVQGFAVSHAAAMRREATAEGWKLDSLAVVIPDLHARGLGADSAKHYAKLIFDRVEMSVDRGMTVIRPYWLDALQHKLFEALPERFLQNLFQRRARRTPASPTKHE